MKVMVGMVTSVFIKKKMTESIYTNLYPITDLQVKIIQFISAWARANRTPISQNAIIAEMSKDNKDFTVVNALKSLLKMGYIRKAIMPSEKTTLIKTFYVLLRSL